MNASWHSLLEVFLIQVDIKKDVWRSGVEAGADWNG